MTASINKLIPVERIENIIFIIRGQKVMLDADLAKLYSVKTKVLIQAVKRNLARFPADFRLQLNKSEHETLRSQFVTSRWGGRRYLPYAFTEQGVAMLSSVLNSERAIQVNIQIMRTFTKLRQILASHEELRRKVEMMEKKNNQQFKVIFDVIKVLVELPETKKNKMGFIKEGDYN